MKSIKRLLTIMLSALMMLSFSGCALITIDGEDNGVVSDYQGNGSIGLSVSTQNNPFFVTLVEGAKKAADEMSGKTIRMTAKAGANGKLFGSVTSKDVATLISKEYGLTLDKRKVVVEDIKAFGTYPVEVKLYNGISASMYVMVQE